METPPRIREQREDGFTLVEILVVILIIGVLAAIAIPSLLGQKGKASGSQAKELARTAQTTAETLATDNSGSYAKVTKAELKAYEPSIVTAETSKEAFLSEAKETESGGGFEVSAKGTEGVTFTVKRSKEGAISRTCTPVKAGSSCSATSW